MSDADELSEVERNALQSLKRDSPPPPAVEAHLVNALRESGFVRSSWSTVRQLAIAAAIVIAFSSGALWARGSGTGVRPTGPRFVLLLYGGEADGGHSRREEYRAWARALSNRGIGIDGEELGAPEVALPSPDGIAAPRGYFVLSAATLDEARAVAASCPHLQHGGRVLVKPIE